VSGLSDWEQLTVVAPRQVAAAVLALLESEFGYRHVPDGIDWGVWERRQDFSQVTTAPCEPVTTNAYTVDWRKGEGRGDVPVIIEPWEP
jgi:hypothetical protein